jgi:hypothetical protein
MKDWTIAMGERKTSFKNFSVNFVEETDLDSISSCCPDSKIGTFLSEVGTEVAWICWLHIGTLAAQFDAGVEMTTFGLH